MERYALQPGKSNLDVTSPAQTSQRMASSLWQKSTQAKGRLRIAASRKNGCSAAGQITKNDGLPYGRPKAYFTILRDPRSRLLSATGCRNDPKPGNLSAVAFR